MFLLWQTLTLFIHWKHTWDLCMSSLPCHSLSLHTLYTCRTLQIWITSSNNRFPSNSICVVYARYWPKAQHTHTPAKPSIFTVWQMTVSVHFIVFQTCKHTRQWLWNNHIQDMVSTNKIENIIFIFIYCIPKQMNTASLLKPEFSLYIYINEYYISFTSVHNGITCCFFSTQSFPGTLHIPSEILFRKDYWSRISYSLQLIVL